MPKNLLSVGSIACEIVKRSRKDAKIVCEVLNETVSLHSNCDAYMVENLRLKTDFLKTVAEIDIMTIFEKTVTLKASLRLPEITTNVLSSTDQNENCEK